MTLYGYEFTILQLVLMFYLLAYGIPLGFLNALKRIYAMVTFKSFSQNMLGGVLDGVWIAAIVVLVGTYV